MKILIVDDETPIREWIQFCIERAGDERYEIVGSAKNGKEAYELFCETHPEVIISDIKMPVMDGIALLKQVSKESPNTVFLILTNHAEFTYAQEAVEFGARKYLLKSELRGEELLGELERILTSQQERQADTDMKIMLQSQMEDRERNDSDLAGSHDGRYSQVIQDALQFIKEYYREDISLVGVAKHVYRSSEYLSRLFKAETGENFSIYLMMYRMKRARELLQTTDLKIYQIANEVGYETPGYFTKIYRKYIGESPEDTRSQYRRNMSK